METRLWYILICGKCITWAQTRSARAAGHAGLKQHLEETQALHEPSQAQSSTEPPPATSSDLGAPVPVGCAQSHLAWRRSKTEERTQREMKHQVSIIFPSRLLPLPLLVQLWTIYPNRVSLSLSHTHGLESLISFLCTWQLKLYSQN